MAKPKFAEYFYPELGLDEAAAPQAIVEAYEAAKEKFPQNIPIEDTKLSDKFKRLQKSYKVLSDPLLKAEYDAWLKGKRASAKTKSNANVKNNPENAADRSQPAPPLSLPEDAINKLIEKIDGLTRVTAEQARMMAEALGIEERGEAYEYDVGKEQGSLNEHFVKLYDAISRGEELKNDLAENDRDLIKALGGQGVIQMDIDAAEFNPETSIYDILEIDPSTPEHELDDKVEEMIKKYLLDIHTGSEIAREKLRKQSAYYYAHKKSLAATQIEHKKVEESAKNERSHLEDRAYADADAEAGSGGAGGSGGGDNKKVLLEPEGYEMPRKESPFGYKDPFLAFLTAMFAMADVDEMPSEYQRAYNLLEHDNQDLRSPVQKTWRYSKKEIEKSEKERDKAVKEGKKGKDVPKVLEGPKGPSWEVLFRDATSFGNDKIDAARIIGWLYDSMALTLTNMSHDPNKINQNESAQKFLKHWYGEDRPFVPEEYDFKSASVSDDDLRRMVREIRKSYQVLDRAFSPGVTFNFFGDPNGFKDERKEKEFTNNVVRTLRNGDLEYTNTTKEILDMLKKKWRASSIPKSIMSSGNSEERRDEFIRNAMKGAEKKKDDYGNIVLIPKFDKDRDWIKVLTQLRKNKAIREPFLDNMADGKEKEAIEKGVEAGDYTKPGKNHIAVSGPQTTVDILRNATKQLPLVGKGRLFSRISRRNREMLNPAMRELIDWMEGNGVDFTGRVDLSKLVAMLEENYDKESKEMKMPISNSARDAAKGIMNALSPLKGKPYFKEALTKGKFQNAMMTDVINSAAEDYSQAQTSLAVTIARGKAERTLEFLKVAQGGLTASETRKDLQDLQKEKPLDAMSGFTPEKGDTFMSALKTSVNWVANKAFMVGFELFNAAKNAIKTNRFNRSFTSGIFANAAEELGRTKFGQILGITHAADNRDALYNDYMAIEAWKKKPKDKALEKAAKAAAFRLDMKGYWEHLDRGGNSVGFVFGSMENFENEFFKKDANRGKVYRNAIGELRVVKNGYVPDEKKGESKADTADWHSLKKIGDRNGEFGFGYRLKNVVDRKKKQLEQDEINARLKEMGRAA